MAQEKIPPRSNVPVEQTWDMGSVFPTPKDWENSFKEIEQALPKLQDFKGKLGESPQSLLAWFETEESLGQKVGKLLVYSYGFSEVDADDQTASGNKDRALSLISRFNSAISFAEPEFLSIGIDKLLKWAQQIKDLGIYEHYFDMLKRRSKHIRSDEVEELLSDISDPFRTATRSHGILANADMKIDPIPDPDGGEPIELAHTNYRLLWRDPRQEVRKAAWENYADSHLALKNTMANMLATGVKQQVFQSRARKYDSALEAALSANFIPVDIFHSLIETFKANLPTWHRYWDLRKRLLGLDEMHIYDTRAILSEKMPEVSFDTAMEWIEAGMAPMGSEYVDAMRTGVRSQRWVDYARNKGKRFGAFSMGWFGTHPFIMMTFNDDVLSLSTLAHELGHSMHSYYTNRTQPQVNSDYTIFVAEVASNFNQALVRAHLLKSDIDRNLKIAIIEEAMNNFHRYFYTMPTLARFELEIHERVEHGEALTADGMIDLLADLYSEGYGSGVVVDRERVGSVWMQFSTHLYSNFYVFQYATGISGAHALAEKVLNEGDKARDDYLSFLKAGGSMYPLDALKLAGVDLSKPDAVKQTFQVMAGYVDQLEELLG